jgi:hypothetical protein
LTPTPAREREGAPPRSGAAATSLPADPLRARALWNAAFALLSVACVFPLFYVAYPPIQDLPQHLAAVRVLHDFGDPAFGFERWFEIDLFRTQYLAYYGAAHLLAYVTGVELACRLLVAASLVATPYAARSLLEALGKDGRVALLLFALAYNAHLVLGFLNFLAAIPLALYGLALAVRQRRIFSRRRAAALAVVAVICFYTHVVPFALLALGVLLVSVSADPRALVRGLLPLAPSGAAALLWLSRSPAGRATLHAARGEEAGPRPQYTAARAALEDTPRWLTDVLHGDIDRQLLWAFGATLALSFALAAIEHGVRFVRASRGTALSAAPSSAGPDALGRSLARRLALLAPLCAVLYFVMPTGYDWIWPIAQRFPLLAAVFTVLAVPQFRLGKHLVLAAAIVLGGAGAHFAGSAFAAFERDEVADFDRALAAIPERQRVVGLIFDRGSRQVAFSPFIHFVAYYQARKGGAVMFTFADFPQSPFRFRQDARPPRVPPRWEWLPERVRPERDLAFYDYALVRGGPGAIARRASPFAPVYRGQRWSVWKQQR